MKTIHFLFMLLFCNITGRTVKCDSFGPYVKPTNGETWPKAHHQEKLEGFFVLEKDTFEFEVTNSSCQVLLEALSRYKDILSDTYASDFTFGEQDARTLENDPNFLGYINFLNVSLDVPCDNDEFPSPGMKEDYTLNVTSSRRTLSAQSLWGIYRGLETFSQLIHVSANGKILIVNATNIYDYPRFPYRGLLLDTARHFIPVDNMKRLLDAMSFCKMNVFHWHLTDDESFPYQSIKFPELSLKGSYHKNFQYSQSDVKNIIEFAKKRGIMMLPEFNTPGHAASWGIAKQELLTTCYKNGLVENYFGPVDPVKSSTYEFMKEFLEEVLQVFPHEYLHLGGNQVNYSCWASNPAVSDYMKNNNINGNFDKLLNIYMESLIKIVNNKKKLVVWEDLFTTKAALPKSSVFQIWKSLKWPEMLQEVTRAGSPAMLSSCWIADQVMGKGDWVLFYICDPVDSTLPQYQKDLIIGGEVLVYTDTINEFNIDSRIWPKAATAAERLWSQPLSILDIKDIARRLEEHTCRMNKRGIQAQPPNGPGACL